MSEVTGEVTGKPRLTDSAPDSAPPLIPSGMVSALIWIIFAGSSLFIGTLTALWLWSFLVLQPGETGLFPGFLLFVRSCIVLSGLLLVIYGLLTSPRERNAWLFIGSGAILLLIEKIFLVIFPLLH